jgi:hypothetical protein
VFIPREKLHFWGPTNVVKIWLQGLPSYEDVAAGMNGDTGDEDSKKTSE